jgi:hypothetical protein
MKAYLMQVLIIDFDGIGKYTAKDILQHAAYPNDCMHPRVLDVKEIDIGEWSDSHPLNADDNSTIIKLLSNEVRLT